MRESRENPSPDRTPEHSPISDWSSSLTPLTRTDPKQLDSGTQGRNIVEDGSRGSPTPGAEQDNPYTIHRVSTALDQTKSDDCNELREKNSIAQSLDSYRSLPTSAVLAYNAAWAGLGATSFIMAHQQVAAAINNWQKGAIALGGVPTITLVVVSSCLAVMWGTSAAVLAERAYERITRPFR